MRPAYVIKAEELVAVNYLGLPAAAVPSAMHESGPVGVQLISRPHREDLCLDAAQAVEDGAGTMSGQLWDQMMSAS